MKRTLLDCTLVQEAVRGGIVEVTITYAGGEPERHDGKCYGYGHFTTDGAESDEPHSRCQDCPLLYWNSEVE